MGSLASGIRDPLSPQYTEVVRDLGTREVRRNLALMRQYREQRSYIPKDMRRRAGWATHERPFVAWDGEGYTDSDGVHHYMLFGCSTGQRIKGPSLGTIECFELMLRTEAQNPDVFHVIFSGNYDVNMFLRDVDDKTLKRLKATGIAHWLGYRMEYIKGKWFRLTAGGLTVKLYDVFTFFGVKFTKAIDDWLGTIDERGIATVTEGKDRRANFTYNDLPYVEEYWEHELRLLVLLCERLRTLLSKAGLRISQWHGPGAIASSALRSKGFVRTDTPRHINDAACSAFSGGRFEAYKIGLYEGEVYQYDIRSAYPAAIATLPSLTGEWTYKRFGNTRISPEDLRDCALYRCFMPTVQRSDWPHIGPFAWRHKSGAVFYPGWMGTTWVWGIELKAALRSPWADFIEIAEGYELQDTGERPFEWIAEWYETRAGWKEIGEPAQLALKLAMNSIYGKLAQQVGCRYDQERGQWILPRFHQLEYAGYILASCRAKLYDAMMASPSSLIAVETDAVISTTPLELTIGTGLGEWEASSFSAIAYLQSGLYFARTHDGEWKTRTRGFGRQNTSAASVLNYLHSIRHYESGDRPLVVNERRFRTIGTHIGKRDWRRWVDDPRAITVGMPGGKREHLPEACASCQEGRESYGAGLHDTVPALSRTYDDHSLLDYRIPSVPYPLRWRGDPPPEYTDVEWWQAEEWDVRWEEVHG